MPILRDLIDLLGLEYSWARAESWDKVGLQIGDANAQVSRVLVAHEVTTEVLEEALGCDALWVYHPPIFRALENLDFNRGTTRLLARCMEQNLPVVAVHTVLDNAPSGRALGDFLARSLGLENIQVLKPSGREALWKITVFVPEANLETVRDAMWRAGAGQIGNYREASFMARGTGTWTPREGAHPHLGTIGKREERDEWRLEVVVPNAARDLVIAAMKNAHPYEEVAHDIIALHNAIEPFGAARMGTPGMSTHVGEWARIVEEKLRAPNVRVVQGNDARTHEMVRKIACVPGSGASYIEAAARAGCDCLVTGDIKHHDALLARAQGISLIDATHTATERAAVGMIADALESVPDLMVVRSVLDTNPFSRPA